jgi:hypothetical protein
MEKFLAIYMNDQLALGVAWRELARRAARNNKDSAMGKALTHVATGIAEDVETFRKIMNRLHIRTSLIKPALALGAERVGRLKLNGEVRKYSPLSRFVELEYLTMGIDGKKQLWQTLRDLAALSSRLPDIDFDNLIHRAEQQRAELEPFRVQAGTEAFVIEGSTSTNRFTAPSQTNSGLSSRKSPGVPTHSHRDH